MLEVEQSGAEPHLRFESDGRLLHCCTLTFVDSNIPAEVIEADCVAFALYGVILGCRRSPSFGTLFGKYSSIRLAGTYLCIDRE